MLKRSAFLFKNVILKSRNFCVSKCNYIQVLNVHDDIITICEKALDLPKYKIQSLMIRHPGFQTISEKQINEATQCLDSLNIPKEDIAKFPLILKFHPITLRNRYIILQECGIKNIDVKILSQYVSIVRRKSITDLKLAGILDSDVNVKNSLISSLNVFPNIKIKSNDIDTNDNETLFEIRQKVIRKFLSSEFEIPDDKITKLFKTHIEFKHKSITNMCKNMQLIKNNFENNKIMTKTYSFMLMADNENVNNLFTKVKEIAGMSMHDVVKQYPAIVKRNYKIVFDIQAILEKEKVPNDTQKKCFCVFGLSSKTIQERLDVIKSHPILKHHWDNGRMLFLVYFYNRVMPRLTNINKKCLSLDKLICSDEEFTRLTKSFGDKTRGVDSVNALSSFMSKEQIQNIKRHPFWTSVPISNILETQKILSTKLRFTDEEIFQNSCLLLYPVKDIMKELVSVQQIPIRKTDDTKYKNINVKLNMYEVFRNQIVKDNITNLQLLNIVLYFLEINHNFTGDGLWIK